MKAGWGQITAGGQPLVWLLLGGLVFRACVALWLPPGFDEAYYYLYSRHLHWSYFDHPLLVAFTTGVGWWLTGIISPFTIRLGALLLYLISLGLLYRISIRLYGRVAGYWTVAIASLVPLFIIGFGILTAPDNPLITFWTATLYLALVEFFPNEAGKPDRQFANQPYRPTWRLSLLGILVGLACLSKYHGFILGIGLVGFCLTSHRHRRALVSPWMGLSGLLFLLTLFPLWYWNWQHDWISFQFQLSMRFDGPREPDFSLVQLIGYWLINIAYLFPAFGFPLWWVTARQSLIQARSWFKPLTGDRARQLQQQRLVMWVSLPIMLGFTWLGGSQQILPAWPAPGFWGMTLLLGHQVSQWQMQRPRFTRRWLWGSGWIIASLACLALLHFNLGIFQRPSNYALLGGLVPPAADASTELIDVIQLRQRIQASDTAMAALRSARFVVTNEYYLGGYIDMAIHPLISLPVTCFSQDPRGFAFWFNQQTWLGEDAVYITLDRFHDQPEVLARFEPLFETLEPITDLPLTRGGTVTETIHLFRATRFLQPYEYPYP